MDDIVIRAMAKWPRVSEVYGWLKLDARGRWLIRRAAAENPAAAQTALPGFEAVANEKLIEFIGRNYAHDAAGRWYFQNGPQRVYVALEYAPFVYRLLHAHPFSFETHTGLACATPLAAWMDEAGKLLLRTEHGIGLILDRDLAQTLEALCYEDGHALDEERLLALVESEDDTAGVFFNAGTVSLPLMPIRSDEAPQRLGFVREPVAA